MKIRVKQRLIYSLKIQQKEVITNYTNEKFSVVDGGGGIHYFKRSSASRACGLKQLELPRAKSESIQPAEER